jgi:hypothetical protein
MRSRALTILTYRSHNEGNEMVWDIAVGTSINRGELHSRLGGGSWQDGITRVVKTDEMLVFTNDGGG